MATVPCLVKHGFHREKSMDIDDSRHHWRNRYLLMRHGHSQANAQGTIISSPERGLLAYGLSPQGEQQLADTVARWHWPVPTQVVHSDFLRTTHTAARVAAAAVDSPLPPQECHDSGLPGRRLSLLCALHSGDSCLCAPTPRTPGSRGHALASPGLYVRCKLTASPLPLGHAPPRGTSGRVHPQKPPEPKEQKQT